MSRIGNYKHAIEAQQAKEQYSQAMKKVTGFDNETSEHVQWLNKAIGEASKNGLKILLVQLKIYIAFIEARLEHMKKSK